MGYWLLRPWRHAFDFSGRSPRREYWLFVLQTYVVAIGLVFIPIIFSDVSLKVNDPLANGFFIAAVLFVLATFIPGLAVAVRRLHDQNKSGLFLLFGLIPGIGGFIVLVFMLLDGDQYENDYGPNPLDRNALSPAVSEVFD